MLFKYRDVVRKMQGKIANGIVCGGRFRPNRRTEGTAEGQHHVPVLTGLIFHATI
jgi:hypothetical protein